MRTRHRPVVRCASHLAMLAAVIATAAAPGELEAETLSGRHQVDRLRVSTDQVPTTAATAAEMEPQRVPIPVERTQAIEPAIRSRTTVPVISSAGVDSVAVVRGVIQLQRGQFAVLSTGGSEEVQGPDAPALRDPVGRADDLPFMAMPFRLVTPDSALTGEWVLRPVYKVGNRLRWESDSERFEGMLLFAVEDTTRRRESRPLPAPIRFEFLSDAESVEPAAVAVEHTNLPLQSVRILARFAEDSLRVHVVPEFDIDGLDIWIPVEPSLTISAPARIQGWGIERARVVARVVGTGRNQPATLTLTSTEGELDSVRLTTDASGSAETGIRSAGLGGTRIEAGGPGFSAIDVEIDFIFPWIFLLAALSGGAFGGLGSSFHDRAGSASGGHFRGVAMGVFAGLLAALAWYALGISLLQFDLGMPRFNELAVFTLAALAGYFGIPRTRAGAE